MASVATSINLVDRMSGPLYNMTSAVEQVIHSLQNVDDAVNQGFDSSAIDDARRSVDLANSQMEEIQNSINGAGQQQEKFNNSISKGTNAMSGLENKVMGVVSAYAGLQGIKNFVGVSDQMTQTNARLNLIVDDGGSVDDLQQKIFASAQRSRTDYMATADVVAKLAQRAGDAFSSNDETIAFAENLNKMFVIAGASQEEMSSASLQLTQALGSGVLRGEELNAVFEAAPNVIQAIADYMGKPIGEIRGLAAEGKITADIVKKAMLGATNEINQDFNSMPLTWAQVWTGVKNELLVASQPILDFISLLAQNWSILEPIVIGVATAVGLYTAALLLNKGIMAISSLATMIHTAFTNGFALATFKANVAQQGLNAALLACPITWIILAVILLITILYVVIAVINKTQNKALSATGYICGAVRWAAALIYNIAIGLANAVIQNLWTRFVEPFIGIVEWVLNVANGGFTSFGGAVANLIGQIISWFLSLGKVVTKIIDAIFGTDWTSGLNSLQSNVLAWGKKEDASITLERTAPKIGSRKNLGDAFDKGYKFGQGVEDKMGNIFGKGINTKSPEIPNQKDLLSKVGNLANGTGGVADNLGSIANSAGGINDKAGSIKDSVSCTQEDLKYLRDLAETEAINRFTTAEIKIEQTNHNSINSDMDLDGVVDYLVTGLDEAVQVATEGEHA